ncbi:YetF domain-containing protein [Lentibacillus saliphilus]|uniref:YetF domain-containing protein n=1 Tax=Lentibacillus saliphilus TaxID=2737028 RepID=UPI001C3102EF|nr:DUF421 domain-containing protein [Lentibacillus saliphilus]
MDIQELLVRLTLSFFIMLLLTRIMGRKEISQMTFFNFVSAIALGSLGANLVVSDNLSIRNGVIALVGWSAFTLIMGFIDIKSRRGSQVIKGDPLIVIKGGQIIEPALKRSRLDIESLKTMLREKQVFSMADVDYAIFETNGKLSVMKKHVKQPVTKLDMNIELGKQHKVPIATEVISDGEVIKDNLTALNMTEGWLVRELHKQGIEHITDVLYAEIQQNGTLYISQKAHAHE